MKLNLNKAIFEEIAKEWNAKDKTALKEMASSLEFKVKNSNLSDSSSKTELLHTKCTILGFILGQISGFAFLPRSQKKTANELNKAQEALFALITENELSNKRSIETFSERQKTHLNRIQELKETLKSKEIELKELKKKAENTQTDSKLAMKAKKIKLKPKQTETGVIQARMLSKKNMHEMITEIYEAKAVYDSKMTATHQPLETLEQYMYTYLNHKYGLKVVS